MEPRAAKLNRKRKNSKVNSRRSPGKSELIIQFRITQMAVLATRVDGTDHRLSLSVAVIKRERDMRVDGHVAAHVVQIGEAARSRARARLVSEGPGLEGSAADIPEVVAIGQP